MSGYPDLIYDSLHICVFLYFKTDNNPINFLSSHTARLARINLVSVSEIQDIQCIFLDDSLGS